MALEDYERSVGPLPGGSPSLTPSPPAPEDVLALMEAAYTGNKAKRRVGGEESGDEVAEEEEGRNRVESFFQELLIDENEGLTVRHVADRPDFGRGYDGFNTTPCVHGVCAGGSLGQLRLATCPHD